jgi:hypothetical protein
MIKIEIENKSEQTRESDGKLDVNKKKAGEESLISMRSGTAGRCRFSNFTV